MKTPESLIPAMDCGIIQEVVRPLMSGKEAQIYVVIAGGEECAAKVYKEAKQRTFKHRVEYTEGRKTRNSRDQRAVSKRTRHGRKQDEEAWRNTEVDMIYRLRDAGVRVPEPFNFVDGVLVMELVKDADGDPAPRLGDLRFEPDEAGRIYHQLLGETVRMLSAGVIHGDLSDFNVLMGANGPVLIDFPQSLDAASNQGARKFLVRDVGNLHRFVKRHAPEHPVRPYAEEMWSLYESNRLTADHELVGDYRASEHTTDTGEVLALIEDADRDEQARREGRGEDPGVDFDEISDERRRPRERPSDRPSAETLPEAPKPRRTIVDFSHELKSRPGAKRSTRQSAKQSEKGSPRRGQDSRAPRRGKSGDAGAAAAVVSDRPAVAKKRRGRRRTKPQKPAAVEGGETASGERPASKRAARARKPPRKESSTGTEASGGADRPARKRRTRRAAGSGTTGDAKPTRGAAAKGPSGQAGSSRQKGEARSEVDSRGAAGTKEGPKRPARRRRRRPRKTSTREPG